MATTDHKPASIMNHQEYEFEKADDDDIFYDQNQVASSSCGCFRLFGYTPTRRRGNNDDYERKYYLQRQEEGGRPKEMSWWRGKLHKAKGGSTEVLGGPRWKTFIRKIGRYFKSLKHKKHNTLSKKQKQRNECFQYDIHSYALNFDEGVDREGDDPVRDFAASYAATLSKDSKEHGSVGKASSRN